MSSKSVWRLMVALVLALPSVSPAQSPAGAPLGETGHIEKALFELARKADPEANLGPSRTQIDVFEIELKERLASKTGAAARAKAIADYFFKEALLSASPDLADRGNFYVNTVLDGKQGYCLSLSAIILSVARRLGLPLQGVAAPRHFFIRYEDETGRQNIETTEAGQIRPDSFYRARGVSADAEKEGVYLRNLTDSEVIAYLLNNEGFLFWSRGDVKGAEPRFDQAIALHPLLAEAWINLGVVAAERGDEKRARELFTRALKWTPGDVSLLFNRSLSAMNAGRTKEALDDIERAVLESPGNPALDHYRGLLLAKVLSPDAWDRHQRTLVAEGEVLRKAGRLRQGLEGRYFADRHLKREVALRVDRAINFEWRWSEPHQGVPSDEFSIRWKGLVDIPEDGVFAFITAANDGIRVWVDGVRIIDNWKENEGAVNQERLKLIRGLHPFRIDYFEASRFAGVTFTVKRADASRALGAERFFHVP